MAGGIDWFRWHHGTVTDQKFPLIAKLSGASVAEVIAVWACLLEAASMNEHERGLLSGDPDFEAMDCALGMDEGKAQAIYSAMTGRCLIDAHRQITAWPKRQPKRERDDTTTAERKRAQREREASSGVTDGYEPHDAQDSHYAPCHATSHQKTPRVEESREEQEIASPSVIAASKSPRAARKCPDGFVVTDAMRDWAAEKAAAVALDSETEKFRDHTFRTAITDWPGAWRNWVRRASEHSHTVSKRSLEQPQETAYQRSMRERIATFAPGIAAKAPGQQQKPVTELIDAEFKRIA